MKNILVSFLLLSSALGFYGCSEDFQVTAPAKEITVVYGLLNMRDTAHYIRIQKAFLDENKSALEMAKVADSNFYNNIVVTLKEMSGGVVSSATVLPRVDMNVEGYPKDSGAFFTSPNWGYKYSKPLNASRTYRLVINHTNTGMTDSAEISILDTAQIKVLVFEQGNFKLRFDRTVPPLTSVFKLYVQAGSNAKYLEGIIRFHWVDKDLTTNVQTRRYADYLFASGPADGTKPLEASNFSFYSFLKQSMTASPGIARYMDSCDFYIFAGGQDFYNYVLTSQLQSSGLTADQIKPVYTNIKGKDVLGLFSSRTYRIRLDVPIDSATIDSIRVNPATAPLNFQGRTTD
jgi:hypothetical protein